VKYEDALQVDMSLHRLKEMGGSSKT
jgi:hypothetical protein